MKGVFIHETATVEKGAKIGAGTKVWHNSQVRENSVLGKNCVLGHCAFVDLNVKIGDNVKLGNKVSVFNGVNIESNVLIGPHVVFTNDKRPRSMGEWKVVKTLVKKGASIGSNSTIICGITLGEYSMVGSGSVVTRTVPNHGLVYGNPARLKGFVCECGENAERKSVEGDYVVMHCTDCGREFRIENGVYGLLGRE